MTDGFIVDSESIERVVVPEVRVASERSENFALQQRISDHQSNVDAASETVVEQILDGPSAASSLFDATDGNAIA